VKKKCGPQQRHPEPEGEGESHREPHRECQREPRNKKEPQGLRGSMVFLITGGGGVL